MMRAFLSRSLFASIVIGSVALPQSACVSIPDEAQKPVLGTHVDDWRDEVIYQVLVDRFADADLNNDYTVQPGQLGRYREGGDWRGLVLASRLFTKPRHPYRLDFTGRSQRRDRRKQSTATTVIGHKTSHS